jgi:rSAM/selenodomain-associated transferase 1
MNAVIIFAKYPADGKVKTRLGKTLGSEIAVRFYKAMAEHTFEACLSLPEENYDIYLFYDQYDASESVRQWVPADFSLHLQEGNDLGEKMKAAFNVIFGKGYKKVTIIGTDCPELNAEIILKSFEELSEYNICLGPSADGGYYLLGMNKYYPLLFDDIKWSSPRVLSETIKKVKANNLSMFILPRLIDIDTGKDLRQWLSETEEKNAMTELIDEYGISRS